ncbi:cellulose biosynthesis protein BcsQ [Pigmentiphaga sp.]|uniref:cellulose biosynthesis protein BcsQ n=1 Tax=Pigmentiphaga sp. TaxID=1977564 RepID=UPI0012CD4565|nr:cellulose biosynthesis protein BcsQ [Pigmentiphaga sp.]MPS28539.1 cellulose synthase operon protein YhjQ [Alcaligenaceae bacterium SAGV5]MPS52202.1 cellulose synthase operon protein YhjQ [Alcaligenaceae bacterium SAGV3]MPT58075.1 cellulose synthase operon protein YhjQ [Alcaligenaceae bacterium]
MKIIAVVSAKGGVGKTTATANLCAAFKQSGRNVLAVDLDPQNALHLHFGGDPQRIAGTSRATLTGQDWREISVSSPSGIVVMPYGAVNEHDRQSFERHLDAHPDWLHRNLRALDLGTEDLVVLDTPPGPSIYMRAALTAARLTVIVTLPDAASYATLPMMEGLVQTYCAMRPDFLGHVFVVNQVDNSRLLARDVLQVMRANFGERVVGVVHQDQSVSEALAFNQSVLDYDPRCQATLDYQACARNIEAMLPAFAPSP